MKNGINYKPIRVRGVKPRKAKTIHTGNRYKELPKTQTIKKLQEIALLNGGKVMEQK